jgi:hypothetical protein
MEYWSDGFVERASLARPACGACLACEADRRWANRGTNERTPKTAALRYNLEPLPGKIGLASEATLQESRS